MKRLYASVMCVSMAILAAEMGVIRQMSVTNSASFAAMIISIALLGFGISGTIITVKREAVLKHLDALMHLSALLFTLCAGYLFTIAGSIEFVPQSMHEDPSQIARIGAYYVVFFLPFFFASLYLNLSFLKAKGSIGTLYFFNMFGSGAGALLILLLMAAVQPQNLMLPVILLMIIPLALSCPKGTKWIAATAAVLVIAIAPFIHGLSLELSPYKDISYAMKAPDAKIVSTMPSSTGFVQVMESGQFRFAPGLSLSFYDVETPNQLGLFIDGYSASGIAREVTGAQATYIDKLPFAAPFAIKKNPSVLVLGAGGGNPVLYARHLGAKSITAVEPNAPLVSLIRTTFADYSRNVWNAQGVTTVIADGRSFCARDRSQYDIITLPAMISSGMSFSSGSGHGENYLFTREAFRDYSARLADGGILSVSMSMQSPPRSLLKLEALAFDYVKKANPSDFAQRIIFLRGLDWGMVLIKKGTFTAEEVSAIRKFGDDMTADFSYCPGLKESELNRNNIIEDELYYKLAMSYITGTEKEFLKGYFFNIEPPTDDRPFFDENLKISAVGRLFGMSGQEQIPFSEWGYLVSWATLLQGILFGAIVILIPLFARKAKLRQQKGKLSVFVYFSALGLGFMLIEISVIQKLNLVIANPLYSVALVISSLLIFSGIGAGFSSRFSKTPVRGITVAAIGIAASLLLHTLVFALATPEFLSLGQIGRIAVAVISLAPVGFFMGMPFPLALEHLGSKNESLLPWGLAVNGSVSVFAAVFTGIVSMHLGFTAVIVIALACYMLAFVSFPGRFVR